MNDTMIKGLLTAWHVSVGLALAVISAIELTGGGHPAPIAVAFAIALGLSVTMTVAWLAFFGALLQEPGGGA